MINVFCVEDHPDFLFFLGKAFETIDSTTNVQFFSTGSEAINVIDSCRSSSKKPNLIFLDLNLPDMTGFDILRSVREYSDFDNVPMIIFSTSNDERDIEKSYKFGANVYLVKPGSYKELKKILSGVYHFFIDRVL